MNGKPEDKQLTAEIEDAKMYSEIKYKAFEYVSQAKYLYRMQVENDVPNYLMHYYPSADINKVREIVRECCEIAFAEPYEK